MKKITLLLMAVFASATVSSQIVLSHSTDNTVFGTGSVACATNPDGIPQTGDEGSSDNVYYRAYTPADFGIQGGFEVQGANFFISFNDVGGTDPDVEFFVRFFSSSDVFPFGTLTEITSQSVMASVLDNGELFEVVLDNPFTVTDSDEIIVAVDFAAAPPVPDNYDIRIGINGLGESEPGYLTSVGCGIANPTPPSALGSFPDNYIILDVVGEQVLSVNDNLASQIAIYPTPAVDVINIKTPASMQINEVLLFDLQGRNTGAVFTDGTVNVSGLSRGVYMLTVKTSEGTLTQKVVKK